MVPGGSHPVFCYIDRSNMAMINANFSEGPQNLGNFDCIFGGGHVSSEKMFKKMNKIAVELLTCLQNAGMVISVSF